MGSGYFPLNATDDWAVRLMSALREIRAVCDEISAASGVPPHRRRNNQAASQGRGERGGRMTTNEEKGIFERLLELADAVENCQARLRSLGGRDGTAQSCPLGYRRGVAVPCWPL